MICLHNKATISWACECEQVNMNESFLEYSTDVNKIFEKYYLTHGIEYFVMQRNILPHVHRWMIFVDENVDDKWKMDELFHECWQQIFLCKTEQKNGKKLCWFVLKN